MLNKELDHLVMTLDRKEGREGRRGGREWREGGDGGRERKGKERKSKGEESFIIWCSHTLKHKHS